MKEICLLYAEEKTYINKDTGVAYKYLQPYCILNGVKINLIPMKNQKELFKYFLKETYNKGE